MKTCKKYKRNEHENHKKHIILVNLALQNYQNQIQHVENPPHANFQLCSFAAELPPYDEFTSK